MRSTALYLLLLLLLLPGLGQTEPEAFDSFCGLSLKAAQLSAAIINHAQQQRNELTCHPILAVAAARKAKQMASHQQISHNLDHLSPNQLLRKHGYYLPMRYQAMGNQIESIAGGYVTVDSVLNALMHSDGHRAHLLAEHDFYKHQKHIGVGYYFDPLTPHEYHWVVYIAAPRHTTMDLSDDMMIEDIKAQTD